MVDLRKMSKNQFLTGMNLALQNARSLVREAKLLEKRKAYSRSFALSVLSLEEATKVVFLTMCAHSDRFHLDQKTMNKIWRSYTSHEGKIAFFESRDRRRWKTLLYARKRKHDDETQEKYKKEYLPLMKAYAEVFQYLEDLKLSSVVELKLKCLYVDIDETTLDFHPSHRVPAKVAKATILVAINEIRDAETLRNAFRRAKTDQLSEDIVAAVFSRELAQQLMKDLSTLSVER